MNRFRDIHDRVDQIRDLHLCRSPRELDFDWNPLRLEVTLHGVDQFGGDPLAGEVLDRFDRGRFRDAQHPARLLDRSAAVDEVADLHDIRLVLQHPVLSGQSAVKKAVFHVTAHLLGPDEAPIEFRIVD